MQTLPFYLTQELESCVHPEASFLDLYLCHHSDHLTPPGNWPLMPPGQPQPPSQLELWIVVIHPELSSEICLEEWFSKCGPGWAASASHRELARNANYRAHHRPTESETLGLRPIYLGFDMPPKWFWCALQFEDHCFRAKGNVLENLLTPDNKDKTSSFFSSLTQIWWYHPPMETVYVLAL